MIYFFFNDTATTEIYTLSLHDALPICPPSQSFLPQISQNLKTAGNKNLYQIAFQCRHTFYLYYPFTSSILPGILCTVIAIISRSILCQLECRLFLSSSAWTSTSCPASLSESEATEPLRNLRVRFVSRIKKTV